MRRILFAFTVACALTGAANSANAASHFSLDTTPGQLPRTVVPTDYDIAVVPDLKTYAIAGKENVTLQVRKPTRKIVLNALEIKIVSAKLDGVPAVSVTEDTKHQTIAMTFPKEVSRGIHVLRLTYTGKVQSAPQGLFHQEYVTPSGKQASMLGTQMESTDARRMFPGWDEPAFRARFHLTATVPNAFTAVSNMPVERVVSAGTGRKTVTFARTPSMSTYLVVLCAGKFESLSGSAGKTKINIYTTEGKRESGRYALESMQRLIPYFENYYGIKFPLPKIDLIAVPGGFGGAMENWGGMTFQESVMLFDPKLQTDDVKRGVFETIAHETSHQWNGDLTTMAWWDGLWLNEGFATWMMVKASDHFYPEQHWWMSANDDKDGALDSDARLTTHPVNVPVHNETEAASVFDSIAYTKAGAFLRMVELYMGEERFRQALHSYFVANSYSNTVSADLWDALSKKAGTNIATMANSWINRPGFPLVSAVTSCSNGRRTLTLTQQRFTNQPASDPTVWQIPLNIQLDARNAATTPVLFAKRSMTISAGDCTAPIVVNGGNVGYYRVAYDDAATGLIRKNFTSLTPADRAGLIDDAQALVRAGRVRVADVFSYLNADGSETNPDVLGPMLGVLGSAASFEKNQPGEAAFKSYEIAYLRPLLARLGGWDGPTTDPKLVSVRMQVIGMLAEAGDKDVISQAQTRFAGFVKDKNALSPAMKETVVGIAGRYADQATYDQLLKLARSTFNPVEMQTYYGALFGAKDQALAQRGLEMSLHLPAEFASFAPFIVSEVGQDHPKMAWDFLKSNKDKLMQPLSSFERTGAISGVASSFWKAVPAEEIESFLRANIPPDGAKEIAKAMESVHQGQRDQALIVPQVDKYVAAQNNGAPAAATAGSR